MSELNEKLATAREGFAKGDWQNEVNVRDFIQKTTPHMKATNPSAGATEATTKLWDTVMEGVKQENRTHAPVDFDTALLPPSPLTTRAISRKVWKKSLVCRPKRR